MDRVRREHVARQPSAGAGVGVAIDMAFPPLLALIGTAAVVSKGVPSADSIVAILRQSATALMLAPSP